MFTGNFFAYSTITVLLSCSLGDILNATLWIASYLWLNVTKGSFKENYMFCSYVAASVVLGISEKSVKITSLMSASDASADRSENTHSIAGAILWHINSLKGVFVNLASASIWLSQVMHSALLLPSSLLLWLVTQFMICVIPSIKSAGVAGEVPLCGVCIRVLVLGWLLSSKLNNGLLCASVGCVAAVVPINGGGVTVGW